MTDAEPGRCVQCGSPLDCIRGTVVLCVRCTGCERGGEIVRDGSGEHRAVCGPAVDPMHGTGLPRNPLVADGGEVTHGDQHLCHACGLLHDGLGAALECCSEAFDDSGLELVTDGGEDARDGSPPGDRERGYAPDGRNIDDIIAVEECNSCS